MEELLETKKSLHDLAELRELGQLLQQAKMIEASNEFSERLTYLDKRYEHLRKNMQQLKRKINELEDVLNQDNDDENIVVINEILETIKIEKAKLRDEASIIRGELAQAMTKENLRKIYSGEQRKEQQRKEELEWRRQKEKEKQDREDEERREREEQEQQRRDARNRLFSGVLGGLLPETPCSEEPGPSGVSSSKNQLDSTYGYESEYDNQPSLISRSNPVSKMSMSKSMEFHGNSRVHPVMGAQELVNGFCGSPSTRFAATSLSNLNESRNSQDSGLGRETINESKMKKGHSAYGNGTMESEDETPRQTMLCFGRWKGSGPKLNGCVQAGGKDGAKQHDKPQQNGFKANGHQNHATSPPGLTNLESRLPELSITKQNGKIVINKNVKETAL